MIYLAGSTSVSVDVQIVDDSGLPVTGLVAATFPTLTYSLAGPNADGSFPALSDLAAITTAYASGGVKERGNGYYRLDVPNAALATGGVVTIRGEATGKHVLCERLHVVAYNPQDAVHLGLSALPNAAANAAGGLPVSTAGGLDLDEMNVDIEAIQTSTAGLTYTVANVLDVNTLRVGGTVQTARDIGLSVLLSAGTGTGQLDFTSGVVKANVTQLLGTAWLTPGVAGTPDVNAKLLGGTAQTGRDVGLSVLLAANQHVIVDSGTVTTVTNQLTAAQIATGVWQDATASDFTTASSIGKSLYTTGNAPGAASGLALVGSAMTLAANQHVIVDSGTVTTLTNLPAIPANWLTAAGIAAAALNGKGDWALAGSAPSWYTAPVDVSANVTAIKAKTDQLTFTVALHVDATASIGGNVTVGGYAAGQDPATLVLDVAAASHDTAGTIGQKINSAGGAADPLTNAVPGAYAPGTAGAVLGHILFDAHGYLKADVEDWLGGTAPTVGGVVIIGATPSATINSSVTAYLPAAEFLKRCDLRTVGDLCSDNKVRVVDTALPTDPNLAAALLDASGLFEAAATAGARYQPADLAALAGTACAGQALVYRLLTNLTEALLWERRPDKGPVPERLHWVDGFLAQLAAGERVLPFVQTQQAGLATDVKDTAGDVEARGLSVTQAERLFGRRDNRLGPRGPWGGRPPG